MLEEKIFFDYKEAMKARDTLKVSVLSFLRAEMINIVMAKKKKILDDHEVIAVIKKQIKQHQDSIEQFKKGNRLDLAEKETKEQEILKSYLPEELSVEEIRKIIDEVIVASGVSTLKDMGRIMKEVMAKVGDKADRSLVAELVKVRLEK